MNREQLKHLMRKHGWTMQQVAVIALVSPHTVRAWLRPSSSKASRNMRPQAAALLTAAGDPNAKPADLKAPVPAT